MAAKDGMEHAEHSSAPLLGGTQRPARLVHRQVQQYAGLHIFFGLLQQGDRRAQGCNATVDGLINRRSAHGLTEHVKPQNPSIAPVQGADVIN